MSGHRQAAVALHGLAPQDRKLILQQLPAADQTRLRAYLKELSELGFEAGPDMAGLAAGVQPTTGHAAAAAPDPLAAASAAVMLLVFEHEPASLVGQFLALRDWRWRDELLGMLPAARRELVRTAMSGEPAAAARRRFLLETVAQQLAETALPAGRTSAGLLAPLLRLVKSWTR